MLISVLARGPASPESIPFLKSGQVRLRPNFLPGLATKKLADASVAAVQLISDKTNSSVFTILISVTRTKICNIIYFRSTNSLKTGTELYCLFITADSIVYAISFIRRISPVACGVPCAFRGESKPLMWLC